MKRNNRKSKPKKWVLTQTKTLDYNLPKPETLHNLGIKHWGLKDWKKALNKILDEIDSTADLFDIKKDRRG